LDTVIGDPEFYYEETYPKNRYAESTVTTTDHENDNQPIESLERAKELALAEAERQNTVERLRRDGTAWCRTYYGVRHRAN
jgi:hypothetical protein